MQTFTVLLECGTIGSIKCAIMDILIGSIATVSLHDDNGTNIRVEGIVKDII